MSEALTYNEVAMSFREDIRDAYGFVRGDCFTLAFNRVWVKHVTKSKVTVTEVSRLMVIEFWAEYNCECIKHS